MSMYLAKKSDKNIVEKCEQFKAVKEVEHMYKHRGIKYYGTVVANDVLLLPIKPMHYRNMWWRVV